MLMVARSMIICRFMPKGKKINFKYHSLTCVVCSKSFVATKKTVRFCSKKCHGIHYRSIPEIQAKRKATKSTPEYREYNRLYLRRYYKNVKRHSPAERNRAKIRSQHEVSILADHYVINKLRRSNPELKTRDIDIGLISLKRKSLQLNRLINEKRKIYSGL